MVKESLNGGVSAKSVNVVSSKDKLSKAKVSSGVSKGKESKVKASKVKTSSETSNVQIPETQDVVVNPNMWVSATQLKNYAIYNTLEDYLELYGTGVCNTTQNNVDINSMQDDIIEVDNNAVKEQTMIVDVDPITDDSTKSHSSTTNIIIDAANATTSNSSTNGNVTNTINETTLTEQALQRLFKRGYEFEDRVIESLYTMFPNSVTILPSNNNGQKPTFEDIRRESVKTVEAIKQGVECIFQAPLVNTYNNTYGIADVIIRSDCLTKLLEKTGVYPKFDKKQHYRVLDIKYSQVELCADGQRIRNSGLNPAYKCQLFIYNSALAKIQNYEPDKAYILGKSWNFTSRGSVYSGHNCFERFGVVEFDGWDSECKKIVDEGLKWLRKLRTEGHEWKLYPKPSNSYLLPNMKLNKMTKWQEFKSSYAKQIKDITLLWHCGVPKRAAALEEGIMSYTDPKLNSNILGFSDESVLGKQLQLILDINQREQFDSNNDKIVIHVKKSPCSATHPLIKIFPPHDLYFSIDFETMVVPQVVTIDKNKIESFEIDYLFMVGVVSSMSGYKCFILDELSITSQKKLLDDVLSYLRQETDMYLGYDKEIPALYHWSNFEPSFLERLCSQINYPFPSHLEWSDLLAVFHDRQIVIKDSFSYSLKDVATALHAHGLIPHCWNPNNPCKSGNVAMWLAEMYYLSSFSLDDNDNDKDDEIHVQTPNDEISGDNVQTNNCYSKQQIMDFIRDYNRIDCQVVFDILSLLQTKLDPEV
jgi:hypothetical protein